MNAPTEQAIAEHKKLWAGKNMWASGLLPMLMLGGYWFYDFAKRNMEKNMKDLEEALAGRDVAIDAAIAATQVVKLVELLFKSETALRERLKTAETALQKEREESMQRAREHGEKREQLEKTTDLHKRRTITLESENEQLKKRIKDLEVANDQLRHPAHEPKLKRSSRKRGVERS